MKLSTKLRSLLENKGVSAYELSASTGMNQSSISRILNDKVEKLSIKNKKILSDYFQVSQDFFNNSQNYESITQVNNMFSETIEVNYIDALTSSVMMVPLVNQYAYAGYMSGYGDNEFISELPKIPFIVDREYKGEYICFEVKGDSMECESNESINEGDILLCRNVRQDYWRSKLHISKWDFVIVHKTRGIVVKRITNHNVDTGEITLHSLNEMYPDYTVNLSEVEKLFNIVEVKKKRKRR